MNKCQPRQAPPPAKFKESIILGQYEGSANDVSRIVRELRDEFPPGTYDLLTKNCNLFSNAFSLRLVGAEIPKWVNRLASTGGWLSNMGVPVKSTIESQQDQGSKAKKMDPSRSKKKELTEKQKAMLAKLKVGGGGS